MSFLGCPVEGQEVHSMILTGPFQLSCSMILWAYVKLYSQEGDKNVLATRQERIKNILLSLLFTTGLKNIISV